MRSIKAAITAVALLSACGGQPVVEEDSPPVAACCSSLSQLPFRPLVPGQELSLAFAPDTTTYEFEKGRQHVIPLQLPDGFTATTIQVKSFVQSLLFANPSAVVPEFVFFDSNLRRIDRASTGTHSNLEDPWRGVGFYGRAAIPPNARYILVIAGDDKGQIPVVRAANGNPWRVRPSATGDFYLRVFGHSTSN